MKIRTETVVTKSIEISETEAKMLRVLIGPMSGEDCETFYTQADCVHIEELGMQKGEFDRCVTKFYETLTSCLIDLKE